MTGPRKALLARVSALWLSTVGGGELSALQLRQPPVDEYIERMDRPERVANLMVDEVVEALGLKLGEMVADIGSGSG